MQEAHAFETHRKTMKTMEGPRLSSIRLDKRSFLLKSVVAGPVLHHTPLSRTGALVCAVLPHHAV